MEEMNIKKVNVFVSSQTSWLTPNFFCYFFPISYHNSLLEQEKKKGMIIGKSWVIYIIIKLLDLKMWLIIM